MPRRWLPLLLFLFVGADVCDQAVSPSQRRSVVCVMRLSCEEIGADRVILWAIGHNNRSTGLNPSQHEKAGGNATDGQGVTK